MVRHHTTLQDWRRAQIVVQSLETGERNLLFEDGSDGRYLPTGHLVFARKGTLIAAPFDLAALEVTGPSVPVLEGVSHSIQTGWSGQETGAAQFAFSENGNLAYIGGSVFPASKHQVVWVGRDGKVEPTGIDPGNYIAARLSSDGLKVLLSARPSNIKSHDLVRGIATPQTLDGRSLMALWAPDGADFVFSSDRKGPGNLFWKRADSVTDAERLTTGVGYQWPSSWLPDGTKLAFVQVSPPNRNSPRNHDIWLLSLDSSHSVEPLIQTPQEETFPEFSPDGRWLAYTSQHSGRNEVWVQDYPELGTRVRISTDGGTSPAWAKNANELFYRQGRKMMAVDFTINGKTLTPGMPVELFEGRYFRLNPVRDYDVSPDGQRFLMIQVEPQEEQNAIRADYFGNKVNIVLNWFEELKRLVPAGG